MCNETANRLNPGGKASTSNWLNCPPAIEELGGQSGGGLAVTDWAVYTDPRQEGGGPEGESKKRTWGGGNQESRKAHLGGERFSESKGRNRAQEETEQRTKA